MSKKSDLGDRTIAARAGIDEDTQYGAVTPPIVTSSNFTFKGLGEKRDYDYTRTGNPTRDLVGQTLAKLEGGHNSVITSTGMSAINLVFAATKPTDLVVAPHDCYGGTYRLLKHRAELGHFRVEFADLTDLESATQALAKKPSMVLLETPSNPLLRITDIEAIAALAKQQGALVVADNTFLSPVFQKPLQLGADIVVHSLTKYINGHSDVVAGGVVFKTPELHDKFSWWANALGTTGAPLDSWLILRGLRTLDLRVRAQEKSARALAAHLAKNPAVARVHYPGLSSHPGHDLAVKQQKGFGAMLSFELRNIEQVKTFVNHLTGPGNLVGLAESLGGFESLLAHPATMTHAAMTPEARQKAGISDTLLRLSVGLEDYVDLKRSFDEAFKISDPAKPVRRRIQHSPQDNKL